jgi:hypothetical protein
MFLMKNIILGIILLLTIIGCAKYDPVTGEKILIEPNPQKKAEEFRDKQGGIFGDINNTKKNSTTFDFATSNVLWRATFKSLDFLPLLNADYSGGVVIYDWYSDNLNSNEQVKITVRFLSNELRSDSVQVTAHKKVCDENNKCTTSKLNNNLPQEIKDKILLSARSMRVEDLKNKPKD